MLRLTILVPGAPTATGCDVVQILMMVGLRCGEPGDFCFVRGELGESPRR
jgi:hypothetical protein